MQLNYSTAAADRVPSPGPNITAAELYGYGDERTMTFDKEHHPAIADAVVKGSESRTETDAKMAETDAKIAAAAKGDCPMPADRLARKQRPFCRRGGAGHSTLLKAAVLASMDCGDAVLSDDNDNDRDFRSPPSRSNSGFSVDLPFASSAATANESGTDSGAPVSPRKKRARFFGKNGHSDDDDWADDEDAAIQRASQLLESMSVRRASELEMALAAEEAAEELLVPAALPPPRLVRRVSRRTSYDSLGPELDRSFDEE